MSRPERVKRQPTANTTPQPTTGFEPVNPQTGEALNIEAAEGGGAEEKLEGREKSRGSGRKISSSNK